MTDKFGRKYELTIYPAQYLQTVPNGSLSFTDFGNTEQTIQISNPFTLIFNIRRKAMASVNTANFQIYNLGETTRNQLYKDYTNLLCLRRMTLRAGYTDPLPIVFDGNIKWCTSYRMQGQTNFITEIEAYDWSFPVTNSHTTRAFTTSVSKQEVVDQLVKDLTSMGTSDHHLSRGYIHQYLDEDQKPIMLYPRSLSGYSWDLLKEETNDCCFIDSGTLHIMSADECFQEYTYEINASSGLLGAPKRSETYVIAEILFEPSLRVGQKVGLNTTSQKIFNGDYKIYGLNHFGTISDAVGGRCQTSVSLFSFQKNAQLIQSIASLV